MDKKKAAKIWGIIGIGVVIFIGIFVWYYKENYRDPSLFLIPQGYVGEVTIQYGHLSAPPLPKEGKYIVYKIPKNGILKTSTQEPQYGWASDKYYYVDEKGNRMELNQETQIKGGNIGSHEEVREDGTKTIYPIKESFLVGTEKQLAEWRKQFNKK